MLVLIIKWTKSLVKLEKTLKNDINEAKVVFIIQDKIYKLYKRTFLKTLNVFKNFTSINIFIIIFTLLSLFWFINISKINWKTLNKNNFLFFFN